VKIYEDKKQIFNETHGFPNNTIHGILEGLNHNLWLSTNQGILRFNRKLETFEIYNQNKGLEVIEFSDGAYFKDKKNGTLFFGGINGFVTISENQSVSHKDFVPNIIFSDLNIFGKSYNISDFFSEKANKLKLHYNQNFFSLKLVAIDFLNSNNYSYSYNLEGLNDSWIQNGKSNIISFTNIPPGNYTLHTQFKNLITNTSGDISSINIRIVPPWYRTTLAFFIYFLLYALLIFFTIRLIKKWYKLKNQVLEAKINENRREELYESKLQFFTNITHELCTPLTLIQGPSEKILAHPHTDSQVQKYASLIINNSEKLNALIQELIEFRRVETHNINIDIGAEDLSLLTKDIASSFSEMAESKNIAYSQNIERGIIWNSNPGSYSKILTNLIANAFKYTNTNGAIEVNLSVATDNLILTVINTGKGIKEKEISHIFDRYKILDALEGLNKGRFPSRNGLGLAICQNLTQLLKGTITVTSIPSKQTQFKVTFPKLKADKVKAGKNLGINMPHITKGVNERIFSHLEDIQEPSNHQFSSIILVIDDDEEMLWFLSDILSDSYKVIKMNSSVKALAYLEKNQVDLIITDILMNELDGISLTKTIKQNKLFNHIPIILLSAVNSTEYQIKGIEAGADIYLLKPFNIKYFTEIVNRFITRNENLKEYHNSIFSSINLEDGNFIQKDDKEFINKVLENIENNISNSNLSADLIAEHLGYSKRNLYRKLKQITGQSLTEIINEFRFKRVEKLLISTKMSTDEIIFKTGFNNRSHFFKKFKERHSMTPKEYRNSHVQALEKSTTEIVSNQLP
jgi:signal transduction histidine kinase/DNA-binding response OmpR family regulator